VRHNLQTNTLLTAINKELSKYYTGNQVWTLNYKIGFVLFLAYFNIYQRKKDHRNIFPLIEDCLTHLNDHGSSDTSLFNGLAGLGWMLQHLNNIGVLNRGDIESMHEIDEFILNDLKHETERIKSLICSMDSWEKELISWLGKEILQLIRRWLTFLTD